jgi:hypothetical protein
MTLTFSRRVDPSYELTVALSYDDADINNAWDVAEPDEQGFFDVFGPKFDTMPKLQQMQALTKMTELVERASKLGLSARSAELK